MWIALYLILHLPILFLLYALWIQHERGGLWKVCHVFGILGFLPDVVTNYTTLALIFGWPGKLLTFSNHLWPLSQQTGTRGAIARKVALILNRVAPSGNHIHA